MDETTGAMLHRAGDCDRLYENTVIMSSLSSPKTGSPNLPSSPGPMGLALALTQLPPMHRPGACRTSA